MEGFEEEITEPVSPTGQYLNSSALCIYILGVLEFSTPLTHISTFELLQDIFLPINTRFSSIMVIYFFYFKIYFYVYLICLLLSSINFSHILYLFFGTF